MTAGARPQARSTVVVLASESEVGQNFVERVAPRADLRFAPDGAELRRALPRAEVLVAWDYGELGEVARVWDSADRLAWIQMVGVGVDGIVSPQLLASDVVLTNVRGVTEHPLAEYVAAVFLFWVKDIQKLLELQTEHRWQRWETGSLVDRKVTVLGAGGVGNAIGRVLSALDMEVTIVGRSQREDPEFGEVVALAGLDELLTDSEFLVAALPLTPLTRGLLDERRLRLLPRGARLANIGRGAVVDERAVHRALLDGHLAAAALDVFEREPLPPDDPLWEAPHLLITSHTVGETVGWRDAFTDRFLANLDRFIGGRPLQNVVDKAQLALQADLLPAYDDRAPTPARGVPPDW